MSIKGRFERFIKNIRPTDEHIKEANRQTEFMIDRLHDKVADDGTFTLEKVLRAGSNAKHTSLRKTDTNLFDVDLGAYYSGKGATKAQLGQLLEFTHKCLVEIYYQKDKKDFEILKSAVRVKFVSGIKLWVDVVPYHLRRFSQDRQCRLDPPPGFLAAHVGHRTQRFRLRRTAASKKVPGPVTFNRLVRMLKWWNNLQGPLTQPSVLCELIAAAAVAQTNVTGEWQSSLRNVFTFLAGTSILNPLFSTITTIPVSLRCLARRSSSSIPSMPRTTSLANRPRRRGPRSWTVSRTLTTR